MEFFSKFNDRMKILIQLVRVNLRVSVLTIVGLTLAMASISSCLIYLESNKADFYLDFFKNELDRDYLEYEQSFETILDLSQSEINNSHTLLKNNIANHNLEHLLVEHPYGPVGVSNERISFLNQTRGGTFYGLTLTNSILNDCLNGSSLPTTPNEVILLAKDIQNITIGEEFNLSIPYDLSSDGDYTEYLNRTMKITGIITPESLSIGSPLFKVHDLQRTYKNGHFLLLTHLYNHFPFFQELNVTLSQIINKTHQFPTEITYIFTINKELISQQNVRTIVSQLLKYNEETHRFFHINNTQFNGGNDLYNLLRGKEIQFWMFFFSFLLFSLPVFLLTILLVNYSMGIINERRKKSLILFKSRGVSDKFILIALFSETFVLACLATIGGIVTGIPFALLIDMTVDYLKFDVNSLRFDIVVGPLLIPTVFFFSLVFILITYIPSMVRLTRAPIGTIEQEASRKKKRNVHIFRGNLGLILLCQGTLGVILLFFFLEIIIKSDLNTTGGLLSLFLPIIMVLAFLSPLTFLIGFILSFNQFIPKIIHYLGNFFWKKDWGLLATATRNLSVNIKSTGRMTLLIACALSFLIILSILPLSLQAYSTDLVYYEIGSDMTIPFNSDTNQSFIQEMEAELVSIRGLETMIVTEGRWAYSATEEKPGYFIKFLGVEEEFSSVVHWKRGYDDQSIQNLVSALYTSPASYPIIIDSISARQEKLGEKDAFYPSSQNSDEVPLTIEGITSYWPGLIRRWSMDDRFVITPRLILMNLFSNVPDSVSGIDHLRDTIWCKITTLDKFDSVVTQVKNVLQQFGYSSEQLIIAQNQINVNPDTLEGNFVWIITNFNFITALAAILLIIVMFTFNRMTNYATEIGLSRALGMKHRQVFLLMFIEPLIVFTLSGVPGTLVGFLLLFGLVGFFASGMLTGPPFVLNLNLPTLTFIYGSVFLITLLAGLLSSYIATRANISRILQVE